MTPGTPYLVTSTIDANGKVASLYDGTTTSTASDPNSFIPYDGLEQVSIGYLSFADTQHLNGNIAEILVYGGIGAASRSKVASYLQAKYFADWTLVGDPGNACDPQSQGCFGSVGTHYNIGTYEVTNAQYAEFLNAMAATDPLGLYNTNMGSGFGGITQSGSSGSYTYSAIAGREDMPVNYVSFYDALRFANWLNNGQPNGARRRAARHEDGAYTFSRATDDR